jgi:hypothetical protein
MGPGPKYTQYSPSPFLAFLGIKKGKKKKKEQGGEQQTHGRGGLCQMGGETSCL